MMLRLPQEGFVYSVAKHNGSLNSLVEWIEGSITFSDDRLSQNDVIDILTEEEIYQSQDFAREWVEEAWVEMSRRQRVLGNYCPYLMDGRRISRVLTWDQAAAYSFCLMLSLQVCYRDELGAHVVADYNTQGILFERLTLSALKGRGLEVHSTAWSKAASTSIKDKVAALAQHLGERTIDGAIDIWAEPDIKDGGLDVVCHFAFPDGWGGRPLYLVQCASGRNWKDKKATPNLSLWQQLIAFTTKPQKGIAMPFALLEDEFRREANYDQLDLLLDRHRLGALPQGDPASWPDAVLRADLNAWTMPRASSLPSV